MKTVHDGRASSSPATVTALLAELLAAEPDPQPPPALTYLRRKVDRGLVAVYGTARRPDRLYTVTVEEAALLPPHGGPVAAARRRPRWQGSWPGIVADPGLGLAVQAFPSDRKLPALASAMAPASHPQLWAALQSAAQASFPDGERWTLHEARPEPVRYKPGDRCVLRYRLVLRRRRSGEAAPLGPAEVAQASVIGKLYGEPAQAEAAGELLARLRRSSVRDSCPAPAAVVESLALLLSEDLGDQHSDPPTRSGIDLVQPRHPESSSIISAAARLLADLHTGDTGEPGTPLRRGADEAVKAAKRVGVLAAYSPSLAAEITRLGAEVCQRLRALESSEYLPSHGSFKPSQLLARNGSVYVVDFDQFCRADPALDVGYFVAYLRPPGLLYGRPGTREWFASAAATFHASYVAELERRGACAADAAAVLRRSAVYEAALLLKIGARRPNRLHSPRPGEVSALLAEISGCLQAAE
jgi:hypothetical protein